LKRIAETQILEALILETSQSLDPYNFLTLPATLLP